MMSVEINQGWLLKVFDKIKHVRHQIPFPPLCE